MRRSIAPLILAAVFIFSPRICRAQIEHSVDFDTTFPSFTYSYDYGGYGAPADSTDPEKPPFSPQDNSDQVSSSHTADPPAATATLDASMWNPPPNSYTYAGWGLGIGVFMPEDQRPSSPTLSDYTVKFDAFATGYEEFDDGLLCDLQVLIQLPDDDDEDTDAEQVAIGAFNANPVRPLLTTTSQTFTVNFGELDLQPDPDFDYATRFSEVFILILQLQPNINIGEVGVDNNNVFTVDNVLFSGPFGATVTPDADFDDDGDVDGTDLNIWGGGFGDQPPSSVGDADGDGDSDGDDFLVWQQQFGAVAGGAAAIPEPGSLLLAGIASIAATVVACRTKRRV